MERRSSARAIVVVLAASGLVCGGNSDGGGRDASTSAAADARAEPGPAPPSELRATALSATTISLTWKDNSGDEDGFVMERQRGCGETWQAIPPAPGDATKLVDTGLAPLTLYCYRVHASSSHGASGASEAASATTFKAPLGPPAAPSDLVASPISATQVSLVWSTDEDRFVVERSDARCSQGLAFTGVG